MIQENLTDYRRLPHTRTSRVGSICQVDSPTVSVITPFFNTGPVFLQTAESIAAQTLRSFEWILVDDGSSDPDALAILRTTTARFPNMRLIRHEVNRGLSAARNSGAREARAPFLFFLDSDDLLEPTALEKLWWSLLSFPEVACASGFSVGFGAQEYFWTGGFHEASQFLRENRTTASTMVRKEAFLKIGGFDEDRRTGLEDWDFWLRLANTGRWGMTVPEALDWYRRRESHRDDWAAFSMRGARSFVDDAKRRFPDLYAGSFPRPDLSVARVELDSTSYPRDSAVENRVLWILPWAALGGADEFNLNALRMLSASGFQNTVIFTREEHFSRLPEFLKLTDDIFTLPHFIPLENWPNFVEHIIQTRAIQRVLISNSEVGYYLAPGLRSKFSDLKIFDYNHMEEVSWMGGGYPRLSVEYGSCMSRQFVASEHLKQWMVSQGGDERRIEVSYVGVDLERFTVQDSIRDDVRSEVGARSSDVVVVFAGRFTGQKQIDVLAWTIGRVLSEPPDAFFLVCGDGELFSWFKGYLSKTEHKDRVHLTGDVSNSTVARFLQSADIFFLPSQHEGIALSIYEAMACGVAIVGADVGGQRELVTPECGVLLRKDHLSRKQQAICYASILVDLAKEPEIVNKMKKAARDRVRLFSIENTIRPIIEALSSPVVEDARPDVSIKIFTDEEKKVRFGATCEIPLVVRLNDGSLRPLQQIRGRPAVRWLKRLMIRYLPQTASRLSSAKRRLGSLLPRSAAPRSVRRQLSRALRRIRRSPQGN